MNQLRYLAALVACVIITLPLEFILGARVYRRPRLLLATVLPVLAVFVGWDLIATARGHWSFTPRFLTGLRLLGLPVEEWLFFIVVPICAVLTYEALGARHRLDARRPSQAVRSRAGRAEVGGERGR